MNNRLFSRKDLVRLIIPLIVDQFLQVAVGLSDSIMVARVGEAAVSGVSLVDTVMLLIINIFTALATGGAVIAGQYLGRKDPKTGCEATAQLFNFTFLFSIFIMILGYLGQNVILYHVFGKIEPEVMKDSRTYLLIVLASIPMIAMYNAGAAIFRAMGNSNIAMKTSLLMNSINVFGNALLIFGFHRGVEGVAIPTVVSRGVACSPFGPIKNALRMPPKIGRSAALSTPPRKFVIPAAFKSAMAASMSLTSIAMCGKRPPWAVTSVPSCGSMISRSKPGMLTILMWFVPSGFWTSACPVTFPPRHS